jgi:hypothetical protein
LIAWRGTKVSVFRFQVSVAFFRDSRMVFRRFVPMNMDSRFRRNDGIRPEQATVKPGMTPSFAVIPSVGEGSAVENNAGSGGQVGGDSSSLALGMTGRRIPRDDSEGPRYDILLRHC